MEKREPLKKVSKAEFQEFIRSYPRPLSCGTTTICEPPIRHYHDDSLPSSAQNGSSEHFFDKEVARIYMDYFGPNGEKEKTPGEFYVYSIKTTNNRNQPEGLDGK